MANIPIAQVPNAPQTGNSAVPLPVGAIRTPDLELSRVVDDASYLAIGKAYSNLGAAGQQAAAVLGDFGMSMARASDEANLAKADSVKTDLLSKYYAEVERMPEDQWQSHWQSKYQDRLASEVGGMRMSTRDGSNRRDIWLQSTQTAVNAEIYTKSNMALVKRGKQEVTNYINRARNEGRDEDAMAAYRRGATVGLWTPEDAEAGIIGIEEERKVSAWTSYIEQKPAEARRVLREAQSSGKPPKNMRPEQLLQFSRMAEGVHSQRVQDLTNETLDRLETESAAITNDDIEATFTRDDIDAPRELINSIKKYRDLAYTDTPEGKAEKNQKYADLWQNIFNYDAESDISMSNPDTHKRAYQALQQEIVATAPEGERKPFLDTLNDLMGKAEAGKKSSADEITRGLVQATNELAKTELFGKDGGFKKQKRGDIEVTVPADPVKYLQVQTKRLEVINEVRELMRKNPDFTEEQAMERFKGILENRLDGGALWMEEPEGEGWLESIFGSVGSSAGFVMNPTANNPNITTAGFNFSAGRKAPASIRHNNAGAMWYRADSWQSKFGATFGQKLNDGLGQGNQIASFPTPVHGAAALLYQLNRPSYAGKTVREAISKWSGGNSVGSYLSILRGAGFNADQNVSDIMASPDSAVAFAKAMARHEAGSEYPMNDEQWQQAYNMFREA
jgi:hypothetical protein